jgi:hypothetical protein
MPTPYIKKIAKQKHKSVAFVEKDWDKAKKIAFKKGNKPYALATTILQNIEGIKSKKKEAKKEQPYNQNFKLPPQRGVYLDVKAGEDSLDLSKYERVIFWRDNDQNKVEQGYVLKSDWDQYEKKQYNSKTKVNVYVIDDDKIKEILTNILAANIFVKGTR